MKRALSLALAALITLSLSAQQIRTNYRSGNLTHISTEYEQMKIGGTPSLVRVEFVGFPDGTKMYLLYINMDQKEAVSAPKGVKMAVTLKNGKFVRLEQIGQSSATPRRFDNGLVRNRLKYAVETKDMEKMLKGVTSVDIVTGWNPEDYIQAKFPEDEFASLLERHCEAILKASDSTVDLKATLGAYDENKSSVMISSNPVVGKGEHFIYNVILSNIYYKNTGGEDFDLAFVIGTENKYQIPYDATVRFNLRDGSLIALPNTREDTNFVYVYPSPEEIFRMASVGISSFSIDSEGSPIIADSFPEGPEDFTSALNQQLQLLMSASPR
ncbi:MAG: hypothetical protein J6W94_04450 [Bacteroidales bacterium]|nr:hypothetical protein [Bacteroidales bacterium]MBP5676245.1 hypothetical protein [Bacteroidales bacterium]